MQHDTQSGACTHNAEVEHVEGTPVGAALVDTLACAFTTRARAAAARAARQRRLRHQSPDQDCGSGGDTECEPNAIGVGEGVAEDGHGIRERKKGVAKGYARVRDQARGT